jgi:hypothetical protein
MSRALTFSVTLLLLAAAAPAQLEFGTSGGSIADSSKLYCCGGTLGSLLNINGVNYILSNNHVLARANQAQIGESIIHPGLIDQTPVCHADATDIVGQLAAFKPIVFGKSGANRVDAAIGLPTVNVNGNIAGIGTPAAWPDWQEPTVGLAVRKRGRTTGLTTGAVASVNVTVNVSYQASCGMGKQQTAKFVNQFRVTPGGFSAGGDSGSLIVDTSSTAKPVGLLFAGSSTSTIGNRMDDVVAALTGAAPATTATASPEKQRAAGIARVKDRYDDYLLSLPEAVGHGVGGSETNPNELVIQLFVRKKNDNSRRAAPRSLEGVAVELVETGEISAVPAAVARCGQ